MDTIVGLVLFATAIILLIFWSLLWVHHCISLAYGKWRLHHTPAVSPEDMRGVSIIKPLSGADTNLYTNLETFFGLKYPAYELLFCVEQETDKALPIVRDLIHKYPNVDATVLTGMRNVGQNAKINNMVKGYEIAKYDLVMVSDSSIRVREDTLTDMVAAFKPNVGIVQQIPYVGDTNSFASIYEKVYFGTQHSRSFLTCNCAGLNCTTGSAMMMRKDVLDEAGGMAAFGQYFAEDYFMGEAFLKRGYRVVICGQPAIQNSGHYSIKAFHDRLIRWAVLRYRMIPVFLIVEPLSECMLLGVLSAWAAHFIFHANYIHFFVGHVIVWLTFDYLLIRTVENGPLPFPTLTFVAAWFLRETLSLYVTFKAYTNSGVMWRQKRYWIRWGGVLDV